MTEDYPGFEWQTGIPEEQRHMHRAIFKQFRGAGYSSKEALAKADAWVDWRINQRGKVIHKDNAPGYMRCPYCLMSVPKNRVNQRTCGHPDCMEKHQKNPIRPRYGASNVF